MSAPLVVVTGLLREEDGHTRVRLMRAYLSALESAGTVPLITAPPHALGDAAAQWATDVLERADGLLLTGGEDVDPARYDATPHPALGDVSHERDTWELALAHEARRRRLPTLAICRGIQLTNVAFGGTLVQDLPSERGGEINHAPGGSREMRSHAVTLVEGSRAAQALGATALRVNSMHHQAVDRIATGFRATGHAPDGVVEAIEPEDAAWWMLGVQWHPEELDRSVEGWDRGLFATFAEIVRHAT